MKTQVFDKGVDHKICDRPDEYCINECSQYWQGECRAFEVPHSQAEREHRQAQKRRDKRGS